MKTSPIPILLLLVGLLSLSGCGPVGTRADQLQHDHPSWHPTSVVPAPDRDGYEIRQYQQVLLESVLEQRPEQNIGGLANANWVLVEHTVAIKGDVVTGYTWAEVRHAPFGNGAHWPEWAR